MTDRQRIVLAGEGDQIVGLDSGDKSQNLLTSSLSQESQLVTLSSFYTLSTTSPSKDQARTS